MKGLLKILLKPPLAILNFIRSNAILIAIVLAAFAFCYFDVGGLASATNKWDGAGDGTPIDELEKALPWLIPLKLTLLILVLRFLKERFDAFLMIAIGGIWIVLAAILGTAGVPWYFNVFSIALFLIFPSCMIGLGLLSVLLLYYFFVC